METRIACAGRIVGGATFVIVMNGLSAAAAGAQTVQGRVLDESTRAPVSGASVSLRDDGGAEAAGSVSNDLGLFELRAPAAGVYSIRVGHLGYGEYSSAGLEVAEGEVLEVEIRLGIEAIPLEPVVVRLTWCRFLRQGIYLSGGRFLRKVDWQFGEQPDWDHLEPA